jgi:hypothetical protein
MKKANFVLKTEKQFSFGIMAIIFTICFILIGCSDVTRSSVNEISSDLRNTAWTRQIAGTETITISFGMNKLTMSSDGVSSQYDQEWDYLGGSCCGNGYCSFYNGQNTLEFQYRCGNNGLTITRSNVHALIGNWTRK